MSPGAEIDRPDPEDDPFACSICGCYLSELQRVRGDDHCESCKREHDPTHVIHNCLGCGREALQEQMEAIDISPPDEYYPEVRYLCRDCDGDTEGDR